MHCQTFSNLNLLSSSRCFESTRTLRDLPTLGWRVTWHLVSWSIGSDVTKWRTEKNRWKHWSNPADSGAWRCNGVYVPDDVIRIQHVFIKKKKPIAYVEIIWKGKKQHTENTFNNRSTIVKCKLILRNNKHQGQTIVQFPRETLFWEYFEKRNKAFCSDSQNSIHCRLNFVNLLK